MKTLPLFGMVLGLGGLCNAWRGAQALWNLPSAVAHTLALLAIGSALVCWARLLFELGLDERGIRPAAAALLREPLAALLTMTSLVLSLVLGPYASGVAFALFVVAGIGQVLLAVECAASCASGARPSDAITPALLMPTVGGLFVLSLCTSKFLSTELGLVVFGAALVSWLVTESIVVTRLMNHALPREKRSTLGIHTTPAAIGCLACLSLVPDAASAWPRLLFGYGLLQALVVLRLVPWLRVTAFSPSAWAYTFGASALAGSAIQFALRAPVTAVAQLALPIFVLANGVIGWIFLRTAAYPIQAWNTARLAFLPSRRPPAARDFPTANLADGVGARGRCGAVCDTAPARSRCS